MRYQARSGNAVGRGPRPRRLTTGAVVPVLLAVLAGGFGYEALQDRSAMTSIVVARWAVPAGSPIDAADTRSVSVHATDTALTQGVLRPEGLGRGWVAAVPVRSGEPVTLSELRQQAAGAPLGEMSIAVPVAQAAGGRLGPGDLVDVIASDGSGGARYVAQGLRVVSVAPSSVATGVLGGGTAGYFIVVAVDKLAALELAAALGAAGSGGGEGQLQVVRSTGEPLTRLATYGAPRVLPGPAKGR